MTGNIKAVVFDWAGTMIDHGCRAPVVALQSVFAEAGVRSAKQRRAPTWAAPSAIISAKSSPRPASPPPGVRCMAAMRRPPTSIGCTML
jgi:beta-phosphoglucomutase-like phosphatase (HAD superfamily)